MAKKKKVKKTLGFNKAGLKKAILAVFYENSSRSYNYKQLSALIGAKDVMSQQLVNVVLQELCEAEAVDEVARGKYQLREKGGTILGVMELNSKGYGQVICDEVEEPVFVSAANMNHALDGDKVHIRLYARRKKSSPPS